MQNLTSRQKRIYEKYIVYWNLVLQKHAGEDNKSAVEEYVVAKHMTWSYIY
jgi:hypothetical protein